jgi:hypothetical protein
VRSQVVESIEAADAFGVRVAQQLLAKGAAEFLAAVAAGACARADVFAQLRRALTHDATDMHATSAKPPSVHEHELTFAEASEIDRIHDEQEELKYKSVVATHE